MSQGYFLFAALGSTMTTDIMLVMVVPFYDVLILLIGVCLHEHLIVAQQSLIVLLFITD